ncbi:MAG: DNA-binding HxlR family transcriptional regulator [Oleiphilaceae bacterium]|jgi:DNA-binding HxlR family transcriptional regulator
MEKQEDIHNPLGCPVVSALSLISGKWKPMAIHILIKQPMRFGQLKKIMSPISQKVLTEQLRELESTHIVQRDIFDDRVLNVTYSLTDYGKSLAPVLDALHSWGEENIPYSRI